MNSIRVATLAGALAMLLALGCTSGETPTVSPSPTGEPAPATSTTVPTATPTEVPTPMPTITAPGEKPNFKPIESCPLEIQQIVEKYQISEHYIGSCRAYSFVVDETRVTIGYLEFGFPSACPTGCVFSHYCAVVIDGIDYPIYLYSTNFEGHELKSKLRDAAKSDDIFTGRTHPLVPSSAGFTC